MKALEKMKLIFHEALEKETDDAREAYLNETCKSDPSLRVEIDGLLKGHFRTDSFLKGPVFDPHISLENNSPPEEPGTVIGRYKLLEQIGEGGMAVVYMAEQQEPIRRKVALKIIKLGMDTTSVIARFEAERQALAMMDHPNIARVLDAGATDTGRPYFVMELVKGASITDFCDANNLTTKERLELFVQVCQAVQHAHQKGIIHRDIKPSNVMVTLHDGVPVPKVIDFGIAKAIDRRLTEKTLFTRYAQIIGTPAYMSPEQAEMSGLDIDIRTDVFSLGTLLYELLTGSPPFDSKYLLSKSYEEMQRIIREQQPVKPSTRIRTATREHLSVGAGPHACPTSGGPGGPPLRKVHEDLDWIVMKTLEKDRNRRYDSVSEFAADIKRSLNNEPVLAGPPSTLYRIKKLIQRRRGLVTATVAVGAALMIGLIVSSAMYFRAEWALRREAEAHTEAQTVTDFLTNELLASVYPEKAKSQEVTVRYILETASKNLENKFANTPLAEAKIRETLGLTYQKMGNYKAAESYLERSLQIRSEHLGDENASTLTSLNNLGLLYWYQGRYGEAEPLLLKALETRKRVFGNEHPDTLESMANIGWLYIYESRFEEGMIIIEKVFKIGRRILGEEHPVVLKSMAVLSFGYLTMKRNAEAESLAAKGFELSRRVLGEGHEITLHLMNSLTWAHQKQGQYDAGMTLGLKALEIAQKVTGEEHPVTMQAMSNLGLLYTEQGQYDKATPLLTKSTELSQRFLGESSAFAVFFALRLAVLYHKQGKHEQADPLLLRLLEISRRTHSEGHPQTGYIKYWLMTRQKQLTKLAEEQHASGDNENAPAILTRLEEIRRALEGDPEQPMGQ